MWSLITRRGGGLQNGREGVHYSRLSLDPFYMIDYMMLADILHTPDKVAPPVYV